MKKICCIFNIPSLYREKIYLDIDKEFDCTWFFEDDKSDIKHFDVNKLKAHYLLEHKPFFNRFYRMKGLCKKVLRVKGVDAYLMIGTPMCVSLWLLCILIKLFHPSRKIYFWCHGWYGKEGLAEKIVKGIFNKLADELFVYSNYAKMLLVKRGFISNRIHVIHNSLDYDTQLSIRNSINKSNVYSSHFGNDNPVIIFIGRLTKVKSLDMLVKALWILNKKNAQYNLVFVGDGIERANLEEQVQKLQLTNSVWFYGACYDEKTNAELIYNADLCVAPGNIGLTAMHVLMFGCPAISHNEFKWQMPEFEAIIPGETGDFFDYQNTDSLACRIKNWFDKKMSVRDDVRASCYHEIDTQWNPKFQMNVLKSVLENEKGCPD